MVYKPEIIYRFQDIGSSEKAELRSKHAIFMQAPRELSRERITELIKTYLPKGNVIFGVSEEKFVAGFENQAQFRVLEAGAITDIARQVAGSNSPHKIIVLSYSQQSTDDVIRMLRPRHVVVVRGSYQFAFHLKSTHHLLARRKIPYDLVSPFVDENEAKEYEERVSKDVYSKISLKSGDDLAMMQIADRYAKRSYDYCFQTGCVISKRQSNGQYEPVVASYNKVIPYQTHALLRGSAREENFTNVHDISHYDTIHAEMLALIEMAKLKKTMNSTTMHIPLLPCPTCARILSQSGLSELVYRLDHSAGYAEKLFSQCGIVVKKLEE